MLNLWSRPADSIFLSPDPIGIIGLEKNSRQIFGFKGFVAKIFQNKDLEVRQFQGSKVAIWRGLAFPAPIRKGAGMICTLFFLL